MKTECWNLTRPSFFSSSFLSKRSHGTPEWNSDLLNKDLHIDPERISGREGERWEVYRGDEADFVVDFWTLITSW